MRHFVSKSCGGEMCNVCYHEGEAVPATHKVGEEIPDDDPSPTGRHNLTAYVCCAHFVEIMGLQMTGACRGV
jgi:hypothetical protein